MRGGARRDKMAARPWPARALSRSHDDSAHPDTFRDPDPHGRAVAAGRGSCDPRDDHHRRIDANYRLGALDHGMGSDHGRRSADQRRRVARSVCEVSAHSAIRARKPRHESRRLQEHLLVGVGASPARPSARCRLLRAVHSVRRARRHSAQRLAAHACPVRARRTSGLRRLVDGGERTRDARERLAIPSRHPPRRGAATARRHSLDGP